MRGFCRRINLVFSSSCIEKKQKGRRPKLDSVLRLITAYTRFLFTFSVVLSAKSTFILIEPYSSTIALNKRLVSRMISNTVSSRVRPSLLVCILVCHPPPLSTSPLLRGEARMEMSLMMIRKVERPPPSTLQQLVALFIALSPYTCMSSRRLLWHVGFGTCN